MLQSGINGHTQKSRVTVHQSLEVTFQAFGQVPSVQWKVEVLEKLFSFL